MAQVANLSGNQGFPFHAQSQVQDQAQGRGRGRGGEAEAAEAEDILTHFHRVGTQTQTKIQGTTTRVFDPIKIKEERMEET